MSEWRWSSLKNWIRQFPVTAGARGLPFLFSEAVCCQIVVNLKQAFGSRAGHRGFREKARAGW